MCLGYQALNLGNDPLTLLYVIPLCLESQFNAFSVLREGNIWLLWDVCTDACRAVIICHRSGIAQGTALVFICENRKSCHSALELGVIRGLGTRTAEN